MFFLWQSVLPLWSTRKPFQLVEGGALIHAHRLVSIPIGQKFLCVHIHGHQPKDNRTTDKSIPSHTVDGVWRNSLTFKQWYKILWNIFTCALPIQQQSWEKHPWCQTEVGTVVLLLDGLLLQVMRGTEEFGEWKWRWQTWQDKAIYKNTENSTNARDDDSYS